ncbi:hypothetical protein [Chitinophaga qingshengii]|uniref:Uncharacterized protein n=1 Tax=Chitinophaga qingshengii TaxID=1569794 RepID=A0ABR7TIS9_9BACT|nr:hypothetical protein [Chitinophaga qingshengii]MBC9929895.1 hypothetical protein [Chitinophaga qingshengii]
MSSFASCGQQPGSSMPPLIRYDSIGTGILQISFEPETPLYAHPDDTRPFDILKIEQDKNGSYIFQTGVLQKRFAPYQLFAGDTYESGRQHIRSGLAHFPPALKFRVVKATSQYFQVVINEQEKLTCFIRIHPHYALYQTTAERASHLSSPTPDAHWYLYETWEHFLQRLIYVSVKPGIPFYDAPDGKKISLPKQEENQYCCFKVGEVKGDWAQLLDRADYYKKKKPYGWVKWHNGITPNIHMTEVVYK